MKRYLSVIIAVVMLVTSLCVTAYADDTTVFSDNTGNQKIGNSETTTVVSGIGGRASDDSSTYMSRSYDTSNVENNKVYDIVSVSSSWNLDSGRYMVFGASFIDVSGLDTIYLGARGGIPITGSIKATNENIHQGWNKIVFVYHPASSDGKAAGGGTDYYFGNWTCYINGVCVNTWGENRIKISAGFEDEPTQVRLTFDAKGTGKTLSIYHDDAFLYIADTMPDLTETAPVLDEAFDGEYTIDGNTLIANREISLIDLNISGDAQMRAYTNSSLTTPLSASDVLKDGNVVALCENGLYTYYSVQSTAGKKMLFEAYDNSAFKSFVRSELSGVSGVSARDAGDTSAYANVNQKENDTSTGYTGYHDFIVGTQTDGVWSYADSEGYLVIEGSVLPVGETKISMCTDQNAQLSAPMALKANLWNKFYTVYRFSDKKAMNVVNGVAGDWVDSKLGSMKSATDVRRTVRLMMTGPFTGTSAYFDDYKIYLSNELPDFSSPAVLDSEKYQIDAGGGTVIMNSGETAADVSCDNAQVKIFTDNTFTSRVMSGEPLLDGNMIVLVTDAGDFTYYSVSSTLKRIPVQTLAAYYDESTLNKMGMSRMRGEIEYGIGGKPSSDAVGKFIATELTSDNSYTFFTNTTVDSAMLSKKMTAAVSIYTNNTIGDIYFATNGHAPLSQNVNSSMLNDGEWNKLVLVYDPSSSSADLYINGNYVSTTKRAVGTAFRIVFSVVTSEFSDGYIYYDDFMIYSGEINFPVISSDKYTIDGMMIHGYGNDTVSEFIKGFAASEEDYEIKIFDKNGNEALPGSVVEAGYTVTIFDGASVVDRFFAGVPDYIVHDGADVFTNGYESEDGKFAVGITSVSKKISSFRGETNVLAVLAQYKGGNLIKSSLSPQNVTGRGTVEANIDVDSIDGTVMKFMVLEAGSLRPMCPALTLNPYSSEKIEKVSRMYEGYTTKAAVFNYDDCVASDIHMIELLDKYGMKGTFNLVSNRILNTMRTPCMTATGKNDDASVFDFTKNVYANHEISTHTVSHRPAHLNEGEVSYDSGGTQLVGVSTAEEIADIVGCPEYIKEHLGVDAIGLAWPNGFGTSRNDYESDLLPAMKACGLKYARASANGTFELPVDWYRWNATCHHNSAPAYAEQFVNLSNSGDIKCFFNWGHTYEFDNNKNDDNLNWTMIENVMKTLSSDNIWFATNGDIYRYVEATKLLETTETSVKNNSDMTLYCQVNGQNVEIPAGGTYSILK